MITPIKTPRLNLREFVLDDAKDLVRIEGSAQMVRFQAHEPFTLDSAVKYVSEYVASRADQQPSWLEFAICSPSDEVIGRVGASIEDVSAWIWYVVGHTHQGHGFATEAVSAFLDLLTSRGIRQVRLECDPRNRASWKLAEALMFELESETTDSITIKGELCGSKVYVRSLGIPAS